MVVFVPLTIPPAKRGREPLVTDNVPVTLLGVDIFVITAEAEVFAIEKLIFLFFFIYLFIVIYI
jgi:hypothetical protein